MDQVLCQMYSASYKNKFNMDDVQEAIEEFCVDKEPENFCSDEYKKINFKLIRQEKLRLRLADLKKKIEENKKKAIDLAIEKNPRLKFLRDFMVDRYF